MLRSFTLALVVSCLAPAAAAQFATPATQFVQLGGSGLPGLGAQAGMAFPALTVFTQEVMLYGHYRFGTREEQILLVGLGVGGSIRALRILYIIFDSDPGPFELDAGLRFGPSFAFSFVEQTAATRARQFRLFADPFVRGTVMVREGRIVFAELGTQEGSMRVGLIFAL